MRATVDLMNCSCWYSPDTSDKSECDEGRSERADELGTSSISGDVS